MQCAESSDRVEGEGAAREVDLHTSGRKDTLWSRRAMGIIKFKYRLGSRRRT